MEASAPLKPPEEIAGAAAALVLNEKSGVVSAASIPMLVREGSGRLMMTGSRVAAISPEVIELVSYGTVVSTLGT